MCNITTKTRRKTADMYKVVFLIDGKYYAFYSSMRVKIGKVKPKDTLLYDPIASDFTFISYINWDTPNYYGKISGFAKLKDAIVIVRESNMNSKERDTVRILKIKIGGEIWTGDSMGIMAQLDKSAITLFGTKVISFKEIEL